MDIPISKLQGVNTRARSRTGIPVRRAERVSDAIANSLIVSCRRYVSKGTIHREKRLLCTGQDVANGRRGTALPGCIMSQSHASMPTTL